MNRSSLVSVLHLLLLTRAANLVCRSFYCLRRRLRLHLRFRCTLSTHSLVTLQGLLQEGLSLAVHKSVD